ncbi:hypothetical protein RRG08_032193 [Elysia crispata]|uniref:Uncharacterized protein n=1 Tax=Elysia crispata TaxID=231223 RepID=A0AAE1DWA9_9GAST|nr:hypothetical protein RRG08_032193 [Elysia crispata]
MARPVRTESTREVTAGYWPVGRLWLMSNPHFSKPRQPDAQWPSRQKAQMFINSGNDWSQGSCRLQTVSKSRHSVSKMSPSDWSKLRCGRAITITKLIMVWAKPTAEIARLFAFNFKLENIVSKDEHRS